MEREVRLWLAHKPVANILIVLTEGTIAWGDGNEGKDCDFDWSRTSALPQALKGVFKAEPLWVDLSFARSDEQLSTADPRFQQAVARLAAPLHGKSLDQIAGEEVRQHRRTRRIARAAVSAIALLAIAAAGGAWLAVQGKREAETNLRQALLAADSMETSVAKDLQDLAGVSVALRRKMLQNVETVLKNLEAGGGAAAVQGRRAVTLAEVASTYGMLGSYDEAMPRVAEAIRILSAETARHPEDVAVQAALAKSHKVQGDILWWQRKDLETAIAAGRRSADAYAALIKAHPAHVDVDDWRLFEYRSLVGVGDIYYDRAAKPDGVCTAREACLSQAQSYFTSAFELARSAPNQEALDFRWKNAVLVSRERLAKVAGALGDSSGANTTFGELLQGYELMSAAQPNNSKWRENIIAVHWRVGRTEEANCQFGTALAHFDKALELARKLHQSEPDRLDWARELATSLMLSAQAHAAMGAQDKARGRYEESLKIFGGLIAAQPANQSLKTDADKAQAALARLGEKPPAARLHRVDGLDIRYPPRRAGCEC